MTWIHIHREEAPSVGDPEEATVPELTGEAPPCAECGEAAAVGVFDGRHLCGDCAPDDAETVKEAVSDEW